MGNNIAQEEHGPAEFDSPTNYKAPPTSMLSTYQIAANLVIPKELPTKQLRRVQTRSASLPPTIVEEASETQHIYQHDCPPDYDNDDENFFGKVYRTYNNNHTGKLNNGGVKYSDACGILQPANGAVNASDDIRRRRKYRAPPPPSIKRPAPNMPSKYVSIAKSAPDVEDFHYYSHTSDTKTNFMPPPPPPPLPPPVTMITATQEHSHKPPFVAGKYSDNKNSILKKSTSFKKKTNINNRNDRKLHSQLQREIVTAALSRKNQPVMIEPISRNSEDVNDPHVIFRAQLSNACSKTSRKSSAQMDLELETSRRNSIMEQIETVKRDIKHIAKGSNSPKLNIDPHVIFREELSHACSNSSRKSSAEIDLLLKRSKNTLEEEQDTTKTKSINPTLPESTPSVAHNDDYKKSLGHISNQHVASSENSPFSNKHAAERNHVDNKTLGAVVNLINMSSKSEKTSSNISKEEEEWTPATVLQSDDEDEDDNRRRQVSSQYRRNHSVEEVMYTPGVKIKTAEASFGSLRHCRSKSSDSIGGSSTSGSTSGKRRSSASKAASSLRALGKSVHNAFSSIGKGTSGSRDRKSIRGIFRRDLPDSYGRARRQVQMLTPRDLYYPTDRHDFYEDNLRARVIIDRPQLPIPVRVSLAGDGVALYGRAPAPVIAHIPGYSYGYPSDIAYGHQSLVDIPRSYLTTEDIGRNYHPVRYEDPRFTPSSRHHHRKHKHHAGHNADIRMRVKQPPYKPRYVDNWDSLKHDIQYDDRGFHSGLVENRNTYYSDSDEYEEYFSARDDWIDNADPDDVRAIHRNSPDAPVHRRARNQSGGAEFVQNTPVGRRFRSRDSNPHESSDDNKPSRPHKLSRSSPELLDNEPRPGSITNVHSHRKVDFSRHTSDEDLTKYYEKPTLQVSPSHRKNSSTKFDFSDRYDSHHTSSAAGNDRQLPPTDYGGNAALFNENYRAVAFNPPPKSRSSNWGDDLVAL